MARAWNAWMIDRHLDKIIDLAFVLSPFGEADVAALQLIATLRPAIDQFFDEVMVMDPNPAVREHRLSLLQNLLGGFSAIADFSEIVTAG